MKKQIAVLSGVWLVLVVAHFALEDRVFSPVENRYLQQRPQLTTEGLLDGTYTEETEEWLLDQMPGRDGWVQARTLLAKLMGRTENQGVYFGKNDYLLENFTEYSQETFAQNLETTQSFLEEMEQLGVGGNLLLVPTAAYILQDHVPANAPELNQDKLFLQAQEEVPGLIRVEDALEEHKQEEIYYRTDHHWTSLGAYYAYEAFLEQTGREAQPLESYTQEQLSDTFYGTSYAKAGLYNIEPDVITAMYLPHQELSVDYGDGTTGDSLYDRSFLSKRDQYRVFLKGNYPLVTIRTGVENEKKLLLIKDSYANTFVQFLVSDYEEIQMVDLRYFNASLLDYAKEQDFTDVLVLYQIKNYVQEKLRIF